MVLLLFAFFPILVNLDFCETDDFSSNETVGGLAFSKHPALDCAGVYNSMTFSIVAKLILTMISYYCNYKLT